MTCACRHRDNPAWYPATPFRYSRKDFNLKIILKHIIGKRTESELTDTEHSRKNRCVPVKGHDAICLNTLCATHARPMQSIGNPELNCHDIITFKL